MRYDGSLLHHGYRQHPWNVDVAAMLPDDVADDSPRPDTPRPALERMREACELPDDLMGGNRAMRLRADRWLPKEEEETDENYRNRVARSTLFPFYSDTVCDLAARPFGRELAWEQEAPPTFAEFLHDVDGTGQTLTVFARDVLLQAIHRGMHHVLVDTAPGTGERADTTESRRVYAVVFNALAMLDIRDEVDESGRMRVTYCRFVQTRIINDDQFAPETDVTIVELEKQIATKGNPNPPEGKRTVWTFDESSKRWMASAPEKYEPGKHGIPLFTVYTKQVGPYEAEPALEDLAWVNLAHFHSRADHAHVMRIARLITLLTFNIPDGQPGDPKAKRAGTSKIRLGPLSRINIPKSPQDADARFLEPSGASIELSFKDMDQLADECKRLGSRHLTSSTGNVTARAVTLDDAKSVNNLQTWCGRVDVLLRQVLEAVAEWLNVGPLGENVRPLTHKEFDVGDLQVGAAALATMTDVLSKKQRLIEAIRRKILRADFPIDENLEELDDERQAAMDQEIAMLAGEVAVAKAEGDPPPGDDPDDPEDE